MSAQAFKLLADSKRVSQATKGTTVYAAYYDDGLAAGDTKSTGIPHKSVTLDPEGDGRFFTVPLEDLAPLPTDIPEAPTSFWANTFRRLFRKS